MDDLTARSFDITESRYLMFTIFSFVDTAPKVCYKIIRLLSKRFNQLASSKDQDALSLLRKPDLRLHLVTLDDVAKLDRLNLMYFRFGFEVQAVHFVALLKRLKPYANPKLLSFEYGLIINWTKPSRATKLVAQVKNSIRKTPLLASNCLTKIYFTCISLANICSTQIFTVLLELNTESL